MDSGLILRLKIFEFHKNVLKLYLAEEVPTLMVCLILFHLEMVQKK